MMYPLFDASSLAIMIAKLSDHDRVTETLLYDKYSRRAENRRAFAAQQSRAISAAFPMRWRFEQKARRNV